MLNLPTHIKDGLYVIFWQPFDSYCFVQHTNVWTTS